MKRNENKLAFITGTSSGLGKAIAAELAARGWEVIGAARRDSDIKSYNYTHLNIDLTDIDSCYIKIPEILDNKLKNRKYDRIALVNNAADTGEMLRLEELNPKNLNILFKLNVIIPAWLSGLFYKSKPDGSRLRIVDISTGAAHNEYPGMAAYCSSKAALLMAGKVFAIENNKDELLGILSYEPGTVDTEMQKKARSQPEDKFPSVSFFKSVKENNALLDPNVVAKEIVDFLEKNDAGYCQKRFGVKS